LGYVQRLGQPGGPLADMHLVEIIKSNRPPLNKVIWCLVVFLFPLVGMLIYYLFSNRAAHNDSGYEAIPS
jgi:hypothetical protein